MVEVAILSVVEAVMKNCSMWLLRFVSARNVKMGPPVPVVWTANDTVQSPSNLLTTLPMNKISLNAHLFTL